MNVTSTLGGLSTATMLAAAYPGVSTSVQGSAGQAMSASGNAAATSGSVGESQTTQDSTAFTRYTSQYRRLTSIVLDSGGKYDHDQQVRAYMELRSMAASGKLQGMQADDQRLWMEVNNSSVSLLQTDSSDSSDTSSTVSTVTSDTSSQSVSATDTSESSSSNIVSTVSNDRDNDNDTVDLSPTAQEIVEELQAQQGSDSSQGTLAAVQEILSQNDSSSSELGSVISLTV